MILGFDFPFFLIIVLFKNRPFRKKDPWKEWKWKVPLELFCSSRFRAGDCLHKPALGCAMTSQAGPRIRGSQSTLAAPVFYLFVPAHTWVQTIHIYIYIHIHVCIYIYICTCTCICICICNIHIYTHVCQDMYTLVFRSISCIHVSTLQRPFQVSTQKQHVVQSWAALPTG